MYDKIEQFLTERMALRILSFCCGAYVLLFFTWCSVKYYGFAYNDFDLAVHDQVFWNLLHGRIFNSILGLDFLGNHAHFISFLIAPFYGIFPHPLFLLFLQTIFLAAGVFPLYALSRLYLDIQTSLIIGIIYLFYPGLGYTNIYEFHPTCFAVFFLLCTAYYFYKENFLLFNLFMLLSLLCQENIALIFMMWGVYSWVLKRDYKWVLWPAFLGLAYLLFCVYFVLPFFNKNTFNFFSIYGAFGNSLDQVVKTCFLHPSKAAAILFEPQKLVYLKKLFVSVSFVPLLSPVSLLPVLLIFIQHLLSNRGTEVSLYYHYTAEIIPFIFIAFIFGVKKISGFFSYFKYLSWVLLLNTLVVNFFLGPHSRFIETWKSTAADQSIVQKELFIEQIPKDASVISTFKFLSHLSHRQDLYSFHYVFSGYNTLFSKPYHLPDHVEYALIDFNDYRTFSGFYKSGYYRNIDKFLRQGPWGVAQVRDSTVLFRKNIRNRYPLFSFIDDQIHPPHPLDLNIDKRIRLYGYDARLEPGQIHFIFYWKLLQPEPRDVNLFFIFKDIKGVIIDKQNHPICYTIWPTQAWLKGQSIEEHQYISISPVFKERLHTIMLGFYDHKTGKLLSSDAKDHFGRIELKLD
jgi:uncharacterized membrane protein